MILALSLSSDVKSIGAYAGFAAIIGLALLVILYFAQARETRRLSDALEEHEARLRRVPTPTAAVMARPVAAVGAAPPVAQPRPVAAPPAAAPASPPTATVAVPGARRVAVTPAATVAAVPAATEARVTETVTDVRPAQGETDTTSVSAPVEAPRGGTAPSSAPAERVSASTPVFAEQAESDPVPIAKPSAPVTEAPASQAPTPGPAASAPDAAPSSILPAATAAGAAAAAAKPEALDKDEPAEAAATVRPASMPLVSRPAATAEAPSAQRAATAADGEDAAALAALADPPRPRFPPAPGESAAPVAATARVGGGDNGPTATLRRERDPDSEEPADGEGHHLGSRGTLRLLAVAIVLVGVLIFVASRLLSSSSPSHPAASTPPTNSGPPPASITVAVLNGTATSGLASRVSSTLVGDGFKPGAINNAPSNNLKTTTVQYVHSADLNAAIEVAHDLQLTTTQVTRASAAMIAAATIAGRIPSVIAVIGSNYAQ